LDWSWRKREYYNEKKEPLFNTDQQIK
jgi:hypothetical protein